MSETIKNFLIQISGAFKTSHASIYVGLILLIMILISFGFGFLYGFKWTIFKTVAIAITIIVSILSYGAIYNYVNNSDDSNVRSIKGAVPLIISLLAVIVYVVTRSIFFIVNNIFHWIPKFRLKRKNAKRKWLKRFVFGFTNAIATVPAGFLMSNIMLVSYKSEDSNFNKISALGVTLMTGGKGESLASMFSKVDDFRNVVDGFLDSNIWNKSYSELSKEEKEKLDKTLSQLGKTLNDDRVFKLVVPAIQEQSKKLELDKHLETIIDKAITRMSSERPDYLAANNDEAKRNILNDYLSKNIGKLYKEAKTLDPNLDDQIYIVKKLSSGIENKTQKALIEKLNEVVENDNLRKKADVAKSLNIFFDFLKKDGSASKQSDNDDDNDD